MGERTNWVTEVRFIKVIEGQFGFCWAESLLQSNRLLKLQESKLGIGVLFLIMTNQK